LLESDKVWIPAGPRDPLTSGFSLIIVDRGAVEQLNIEFRTVHQSGFVG
jgi:hypothetical protein